jgi:hypothetical protein
MVVHETYSASLSDGRIAKQAPYIYCVYCAQPRAIYIGQTANMFGALGRLSQHLSDRNNNTLKQRLSANFGYVDVDPIDVEFFAIRLNPHHTYFGNREFREAVEHLTQQNAISFIIDQELDLPVISRTDSNGYLGQQSIIEEANRISGILTSWLSTKRKARKVIG